MPILESVASAFTTAASGQLGREAIARGLRLVETRFNELKSTEAAGTGEMAREVPAQAIEAQAEAHLLEREMLNREQIREVSPFSDTITERIRNPEEVSVYREAGLQEASVNGRPSLVRPNIDPEIKDDFGRTNEQRMQNGLSPLDGSGEKHELHHIGQAHDAPLAELTYDEHRGHSSILHEKSESVIDRTAFRTERANHWKSRAAQIVA